MGLGQRLKDAAGHESARLHDIAGETRESIARRIEAREAEATADAVEARVVETPGELSEPDAAHAEQYASDEPDGALPEPEPEASAEHVTRTGRRDSAPIGRDTSTTLGATLKRTWGEFREDGLTDWAASLTYYGLLALFPGLIAFVSILGLFGDPQRTTAALLDIVHQLAPSSASSTFEGPIQSIIENKGTAGVMFVVGLVASLWSASGYVGAFSRAANVIYETPEGRPFWKLRPLQLAVTFVMVVLLVFVVLALVFTGPVVDAVAAPLGLGSTAVTVWNIAKWPVLVFVVLLMLGVLYYASPNVRLPKFSLITPGAILALGVWVLASVAFAFYVGNFGSYDKTYGTLGGVISLLVWLWISNIAVLLGAQLNAEIERTRELKAGIDDAAREIQLDARAEPAPRHTA
ncbi:MAG: YihY/virulence factor BrkB family protein [Patulibacter minatonensis]